MGNLPHHSTDKWGHLVEYRGSSKMEESTVSNGHGEMFWGENVFYEQNSWQKKKWGDLQPR